MGNGVLDEVLGTAQYGSAGTGAQMGHLDFQTATGGAGGSKMEDETGAQETGAAAHSVPPAAPLLRGYFNFIGFTAPHQQAPATPQQRPRRQTELSLRLMALTRQGKTRQSTEDWEARGAEPPGSERVANRASAEGDGPLSCAASRAPLHPDWLNCLRNKPPALFIATARTPGAKLGPITSPRSNWGVQGLNLNLCTWPSAVSREPLQVTLRTVLTHSRLCCWLGGRSRVHPCQAFASRSTCFWRRPYV